EMRRLDGTVLRRLDAASVQVRLGEPTVVALRPVLHGALLNAVGSDTLKLGSRGTAVERHAGGAALVLESGERVQARVLIGADGVDSMVRRTLHPSEPKARPSGLFALRGVSEANVSMLGDASGAQYFGRGIEAGVARASESMTYWYVSLPA